MFAILILILVFLLSIYLTVLLIRNRMKSATVKMTSLKDKTKFKLTDVFSNYRKRQGYILLILMAFTAILFCEQNSEDVFVDYTTELRQYEDLQLQKGEIKIEEPKPVQAKETPKIIKPKVSKKIVVSETPIPKAEKIEETISTTNPQPTENAGAGGTADDAILKFVHQWPLFPGCDIEGADYKLMKQCADQKLQNFLNKNLKYPPVAVAQAIEGTVLIQFVVEKNGTITDVKIVKDIGHGCGNEARRVVELMNSLDTRWKPGMQSGRPVRFQYTLPVLFKGRQE